MIFALITIVISCFIWLIFTWPLAQHLDTGICSSSQNIEKGAVRSMIPGDHFQLMYHFGLAEDMLNGTIKPFHNPYEFNDGDDEKRFRPGAYFAPFSLCFAFFSPLLGQSVGWNITSLLSIVLTYLASFLLCRRYTPNAFLARLAALLSITLPVRWISLLGGSPAGFAMLWIPVLYLGLDIAIRDRRASGGVLAGVALLFSAWTDLHVFFFSALSSPAWCLIALIQGHSFNIRDWKCYKRLIYALLPFAGFALLTAAYMVVRNVFVLNEGSYAGNARTSFMLFSPVARGLVSASAEGVSRTLYLGFLLIGTLCTGTLFIIYDSWRNRFKDWHIVIVTSLLVAGCGLCAILALGSNGPAHGKIFKLCRTLIPPYSMVRQPAKIFCLLPTLTSMIAAGVLAFIFSRKRSLIWYASVGIVAFAIAASLKSQTSATICLLDGEQPAYAAVTESATAKGEIPRALVIPLWPGDSANSSVYLHYARQSHIRMVNGYSPVSPGGYMENVFMRLESINKGFLRDDQVAWLQSRGIHHIILHENAFPEKVSPFPVCFTLKRLLNHPRLELLKQASEIWTFKIVDRREDAPHALRKWDYAFPTRRWQASRCADENALTVDDATAGNGKSVILSTAGGQLITKQSPRAPLFAYVPSLRWLIRAKGEGTLRADTLVGSATNATQHVKIDSQDWQWSTVSFTPFDDYDRPAVSCRAEQGTIMIDSLILAAGPWHTPTHNTPLEIPASCFFHAGYTDVDDHAVVLRPDYEPNEEIFYGPHLPLERGHFRLTLVFASDATPGTRLGELCMHVGREPSRLLGNVCAGEDATFTFETDNNLPVRFGLKYSREAEIRIKKMQIESIELATPSASGKTGNTATDTL